MASGPEQTCGDVSQVGCRTEDDRDASSRPMLKFGPRTAQQQWQVAQTAGCSHCGVLATIPVTQIKRLTKAAEVRKGLTHRGHTQTLIAEKAWQQELEATGHMTSAAKRQCLENTALHL